MPRRGFTVKKNWDNPVEHAMPAEARVPAEVRLGAVVVRPATVLAPMAGVTDTVFRRFIRHASLFSSARADPSAELASQVSESRLGAPNSVGELEIDAAITNAQSGCGLLMTEFTSADGLARMRETKRRRYLTFYDDEHPIGAQLFGSNPATLAEAARIVEETGFDHGGPESGLPGKARGGVERRVGPAARSAEDRRDLSRHSQGGDDSLHREVPHGLERERDCVRGAGADGRSRRARTAWRCMRARASRATAGRRSGSGLAR